MPYIKPKLRELIDETLAPVMVHVVRYAPVGEVNYILTRVLLTWIEAGPTNYDRINAVIGVLECAKLEMYRRLAAPYEDAKKASNGDVYE